MIKNVLEWKAVRNLLCQSSDPDDPNDPNTPVNPDDPTDLGGGNSGESH